LSQLWSGRSRADTGEAEGGKEADASWMHDFWTVVVTVGN
jgi:hypothetical protein